MKMHTKLAVSAVIIYLFAFILFFFSGCKEKSPFEKVTLRQPYVENKMCVVWKYEKDEWKAIDKLPLEACDLVFGVTWGDFEYLRRWYEERIKTCK